MPEDVVKVYDVLQVVEPESNLDHMASTDEATHQLQLTGDIE